MEITLNNIIFLFFGFIGIAGILIIGWFFLTLYLRVHQSEIKDKETEKSKKIVHNSKQGQNNI